jgi:hypothetical protein
MIDLRTVVPSRVMPSSMRTLGLCIVAPAVLLACAGGCRPTRGGVSRSVDATAEERFDAAPDVVTVLHPDAARTTADAPSADLSPDAPAADAGPDAGGWTPLALPRLAVWLDAGRGLVTGAGGRVTRWEDQSGKGHHFTEPLVAAQPVRADGAAHGRAAVHFDGANRLSIFPGPEETASLSRGTEDFVVAVVASVSNRHPQDSWGTLWWEEGVRVMVTHDELDTEIVSNGTVYVSGGSEQGQTYYDGEWRLYALYRVQGSFIEPRINGYIAGVSGPGDPPFPVFDVEPSAMTLGQLNPRYDQADGAYPLRGDIAEVVVARADRSELAALEQYLIGKYKLNVPVKRTFGETCAGDLECTLNHCSQGVCCQTGCGQACASCAVPGHLGVCWNVPGCGP